MSKVIGNEKLISRAKQAPAGDKSVYINWDAVNELPDQYEILITEVKYNPAKLDESFSDVGSGSFMPKPELMYEIAEACGISGGENSISEPLVEFVDINPMLMKLMSDAPTERKMTVGRMVKKISERLQEDGTFRRSSVCTSEYNVWERCLEAWSKEELYTKGYTKPAKYPNKYDTMHKRKAHFNSEMKFAHAKAETKAYLKTIRELASLMTGYKKEDLTSGSLVFARVRRSKEVLQLESAARLAAIAGGHQPQITAQLFDGEPEPISIPEPAHVEVVKTKRDILIETFKQYITENIVPTEAETIVTKTLEWVVNNPDAESNKLWSNAIDRLKAVETMMDASLRKQHNLY